MLKKERHMNKFLVVVSILLAASTQAFGLSIAFNAAADAGATSLGFTQWTSTANLSGTQTMVVGAQTVNVTPYLDSRDPTAPGTPLIQARNRTTSDAGYAPVDPAVFNQFWRAERTTSYNTDVNSWPAYKIEVVGLNANSAYQVVMGSFDRGSAFQGLYQNAATPPQALPFLNILQPGSGSGTAGAVTNWQFNGRPTVSYLSNTALAGAADTGTAADTFTTNGSGVLTVDWILNNINDNKFGNAECVMNFLVVNPVPEPATMSLLGLGGLIMIKRRK
jgi:hypothetical protein